MLKRSRFLRDQIEVTNPFDGSIVGTVPCVDEAGMAEAVDDAERGALVNKRWPRWRRAELLAAMSAELGRDVEGWARLISCESGKTIRQARKEVARATITFDLCAQEARRLGGEVLPFDGYRGYDGWSGYFTRHPLGVVVGITPFNDPLNLVSHKMGPSIAAGNGIVVKPSDQVPLSALRLQEALVGCGMPPEFVTVRLGSATANRALVRDRRVRMISFTGGNDSAEAIVRDAGVKRYTMDLGGNAPVIVMADADVEHAATSCVGGAFWANGHNCIGVQRIFVERKAVADFLDLVVAKVAALKVGNPLDEATDIGPVVSDRQADRIKAMVDRAIAEGATCLYGNERSGRLLAPTVLYDCPRDSEAWREEIFGPVVIIEPFDDLDVAIALANLPESSIHAAVFTSDLGVMRRCCDELEASGVVVNASTDFRFDGMPFGGFKFGSVAREGVRFAVQEMTQTKAVIHAPANS